MPDGLADLLRRHARRKLGPHGLDPRYHALYQKASALLGDWLQQRGTARDLCVAIHEGLPILEVALSEASEDAIDVARWTVRHELRDLGPEDMLTILDRLAKRAPRHHVVLASGSGWACPYCGAAHVEWTLGQLEAGIAFLRAEGPADGTAADAPPAG